MPQHVSILVVDSEDERRKLTEQTLTSVGGFELKSLRFDDAQAVLGLIDELAPNVVVFGASPTSEDVFSFVDELTHAKPTLGVAIASTDDASEVVMRALRAGADEFIKLPVQTEEIAGAVQRILRRKGQQVATGEGQVVTVFSGKGGCGSTMIATNLAVSLAEELPGETVVIVDLNLQLGDVATFMDIRPRLTIGDTIKEADRLDPSLLKSFLSPHPSGAFVLACPNDPTESEAITGEQLGAVLAGLGLHVSRTDFNVELNVQSGIR